MKKLLLLILVLWADTGTAQTVGQFRYDTTKFLKVGGRNQVVIENIATTDTTFSKPVGIDANGNILRLPYWPTDAGGSIDYVVPGFGVKVDSINRTYTVSADTNKLALKDTIKVKKPLYVSGDTLQFLKDSSYLVKNVFLKTGTDSVFKTINGVDSFAFLLPSGGGTQTYLTQNAGILLDSLTTPNTYGVGVDTSDALVLSRQRAANTYLDKTTPQSAYTLFGRGSGTGSPSFLASIDSNWVTGLHSENYYNTKYAAIGGGSGWSLTGNSISNTNFIGSTNPSSLVVKVNNIETARFDSLGKFKITNSGFGSAYLSPGAEGELLIGTSISTGGGTLTVGNLNLSKSTSAELTVESTAGSSSVHLNANQNSFIRFTQRGAAFRGLIGYAVSSNDMQFRVNAATSMTTGTQAMRIFGTQNVHIGTSTSDISSAIFNVQSTTKGALPAPQMTTTQKLAIATPAEGLEVYDLTLHQKSYYNGTTWINY